MKVYFTCSTLKLQKYRSTYFGIRNFLISEDHLLTRDWLPHTEKLLKRGNTDVRNIDEIYKKCITAISESDVVIVEDTVSNFSTGHQITIALQQRKPTLVLWQGKKKTQFKQMFIHGIDSDLLEVAEYENNKYKKVIKRFINKYESFKQRNRFHLVLSNIERNYLDWAQFNGEKSRTQIIRDAIRKELNSDKEYQKYLEKYPQK